MAWAAEVMTFLGGDMTPWAADALAEAVLALAWGVFAEAFTWRKTREPQVVARKELG